MLNWLFDEIFTPIYSFADVNCADVALCLLPSFYALPDIFAVAA